MVADMLINKKHNPIVTELFITDRKLSISLVFITRFCFAVPKDIRINSAHYFIMKIPNKWELKQTESHNSSGVDFKDFINLYKKCTAKTYSCLVIDATFVSDNPLRFRKNLTQKTPKKPSLTIDDKIRDEKLEYHVNRKAAKISALSSGKIDKYEYLRGEEILPPEEW